ncbi:MAG: hypothetical protein VZQ83_00175 [Eubacterium sp.]|nr:hypothetical protein [Eubacterium sp.]
MGNRSKDEKLEIVRELAVAMAPYLWERRWGFGLNLYFDDVHVDYRQMNGYIFSAEMAEDASAVLAKFDEACVEDVDPNDEKYLTYKDMLALDDTIEIYVSCEQEIYEQLYLYQWEDDPSGKGMADTITATLKKHGMIWNLEDYSIQIYSE